MRHNGNRKISVKKTDLIEKLKENKEAHIKAYKKAVVAYKKEAIKQLAELTRKAKAGETKLYLNLVTPIDNSENYDKIIEMFKWEVADIVDLEQQEFNEYVHDDTEFARIASVSNMAYLV